MRNLFKPFILALFASSLAHATTYTVPASASAATIQSTINTAQAAGPNNLVLVAPGTFNLASQLTMPCTNGLTLAAQNVPAFVPGTGIVPSTILNATFTNSNLIVIKGVAGLLKPGAGCSVLGLGISGQNVYVVPPTSGLIFEFNQVYSIYGSVKGTGNSTSYSGVYIDNGQPLDIAYSTFAWNTFGPSCSDIDASTSTDYNGACGGIVIHGSNSNVTIANNNVSGQIEELVHTLAQGTYGQLSTNLLIQNNDCGYIHRICVELQQSQVTNAKVLYNSAHDWATPTPFSFGLSLACCFAPNSPSPGVIVTGNLLIFNTPCVASYCMGYGIEAWANGGLFTNNVIQASTAAKVDHPISFGGATGATATSPVATGNIVQGYSVAVDCEDGGTLPTCTNVTGTPVYAPNTVASTNSALVSTAPAVGLNGAAATITETAPNTQVYYTLDGTTPVVGKSAVYSGALTLQSGQTLKAIAMWGQGANPPSYPAGFGYIPSAVVSATYQAVVVPPPPVVVPPATVPLTCKQSITGTTFTMSCSPVTP